MRQVRIGDGTPVTKALIDRTIPSGSDPRRSCLHTITIYTLTALGALNLTRISYDAGSARADAGAILNLPRHCTVVLSPSARPRRRLRCYRPWRRIRHSAQLVAKMVARVGHAEPGHPIRLESALFCLHNFDNMTAVSAPSMHHIWL